MLSKVKKYSIFFNSLSFKLFAILFATVFLAFLIHSLISARNQSRIIETQMKNSAYRASDFMEKSLYSHMLQNEREQTHRHIIILGQEPGVEVVRIYNKQGDIKFSSREEEIGRTVDMQAEACYACHAADQPLEKLSTQEKARIYEKDDHRVLGLINPIANEKACWNAACHAHSQDQTILGVLDVQMDMESIDLAQAESRRQITTLAGIIIVISMVVIGIIIYWEIYVPIHKLRQGTEELAEGNLEYTIHVKRHDEFGLLATSFNRMAKSLKRADAELRAWSDTLEKRVEEKTEELEEMHHGMIQVEKMASLGKMAATVAHELNNPLSGIVTYAKVLMKKLGRRMEEGEDKEVVMEELDLIRSESMRCGNIVKDLLIFARESSADFQKVQLHQIIERALKLVRHHLELGKIALTREFNLEDDQVICDQEQLVQALVALMINAIEAMSEGGKLTVGTAPLSDRDPEEVQIYITDTGVGISKEVQDKIFDPFFSTKNATKGVGLGLAVVYGIIQRHDGRIYVESQTGEGTTFFIEIPREEHSSHKQPIDKAMVTEGL
ncbi:MAG: HAMP domain-containing protein [Candidatus Marinimicrobia bacterium]|nr:HAMP domain-containing protein [Candidatus Neomarinimicrobiota bacterium]